MANKKFWLVLSLEIIVALAIFIGLTKYQERDLLDYNQTVANLSALELTGQPFQLIEQLPKAEHHLLYFFAPWCQICHLSIENLNDVRALYSEQQINIIIIALDYQNKAEVEDFISEHELPFKVILGDSSWQQAFKIKGFPTYYITDHLGKVQQRSIGYSSALGMLQRLYRTTN